MSDPTVTVLNPLEYQEFLQEQKRTLADTIDTYFSGVEAAVNIERGSIKSGLQSSSKFIRTCTTTSGSTSCTDSTYILANFPVPSNASANETLNTLLETATTSMKEIYNDIRVKEQQINDNMKLIKESENNMLFAKEISNDFTELHKYYYLRNWSIFLSIAFSYFVVKWTT